MKAAEKSKKGNHDFHFHSTIYCYDKFNKKNWGCPYGPGYPFQVLARPAFQGIPCCGLSTSIPHPKRRSTINKH